MENFTSSEAILGNNSSFNATNLNATLLPSPVFTPMPETSSYWAIGAIVAGVFLLSSLGCVCYMHNQLDIDMDFCVHINYGRH